LPESGDAFWDVKPSQAVELQKRLARQVLLRPLPGKFSVLGAADIGYVKASRRQIAVVVTYRWPELELLETAHAVAPETFPYIPGLLSFREIPALLQAHEKLSQKPEVFLCDGQGIAHPRRLGLASHLGLCLSIPSVGCAKSRLCGEHEPLGESKGSRVPLVHRGEAVGWVYRSRNSVKPLYISPGHLADLESSCRLVEACLRRYRLPEPLREAHNAATRLRRQWRSPEA